MRNRILASSLTLNTHHEERLHCNEVTSFLLGPKTRFWRSILCCIAQISLHDVGSLVNVVGSSFPTLHLWQALDTDRAVGLMTQEIMDKEQMLLLEEVAEFQSRLEQHTVSTEDVMQLTTLQVIEDVFPVRFFPPPLIPPW